MRGQTTHERAAETFLSTCMANMDYMRVIGPWVEKLADGRLDVSQFETYGQTHPGAGKWPVEQLCCAISVHSLVNSGRYARYPLHVGTTPNRDKDRAGNAAALSALRAPFKATVDLNQNGGDEDGLLEWSESITLVRSTGFALIDPAHGHEPLMAPRTIGARTAPLEIGYTKPSRTMFHLDLEGAVARWPYGHDYITLIVDLERRSFL